MPRRKTARTLVLLLLASGSSGQTPGAETRQQRPELQLPVTTEVVRIDVVVTGKGGNPRQGLTREDFVVLEDGQPQPITQFQVFAAPPPVSVTTVPKVGVPRASEAPQASSEPATRRHVVLVVDDLHVEAVNLQRLRSTLDRFLERDVPPEDQVALVTTSGSRSQDFTSDRHTLRQVVARLSVQDRRARPVDVPFIDEYQAERILLGDPEALRVAVEEIRARRQSPNAAAEAQGVARMVHADAVASSRNTLETLDSLVRSMASLSGRKVVILVSDGFLTGLQLQGRAAFDIRRITDAGARSGVIVYGLDSRGLQANAPGYSASSRGPVLPSTVGPRETMARSSELAIHDAMNALSADTGGFLMAFTNDFSGALRKIIKDTESYYLLAYEPTNGRRDGAFRKIEVRLPGRRDVRIRHRKGYFGPDDRKRETPPRVAAPGASAAQPAPEERIRGAIREALSSPAARAGLPVRLSADFVSVDAATAQIVVSGHLDLHDLPFARTGDRRLATVDLGGAVFDEAGAEVGTLAIERAALDLTDEAYARALATGLEYQRSAPVKPGRYRVGIAVREEGSGKIGSANEWVDVPDLADGKLALSSLFLMKEDDSASGTPRASDAGPSLRGVQARPGYKRLESLHVQFFAYNHGGAAGSFVTRTEIWRRGVLLAASRPEALKAPRGDGSQDAHTRKIALRTFEPGDYEVRVVVKDERTNAETSQRAAFTIE